MDIYRLTNLKMTKQEQKATCQLIIHMLEQQAKTPWNLKCDISHQLEIIKKNTTIIESLIFYFLK